jgi:hypothetical protein
MQAICDPAPKNWAKAFSAFLAVALFCGTSQALPANPPIFNKELIIATLYD